MDFQRDDNGAWWGTEGDSKVRVFRIPEPNLPGFEERLVKLQRRAKRIGVEEPSYKVVGEEFKEVEVEPIKRLVRFVYITLHHPQVKVADHEFMAALEHTEEGNILHVLEGKSIPTKYRNADAWCDHCRTRRYRKETFILQKSVTGEYTQVGRNCLADYLGRDAERYADAAELYSAFGELASASEGEGFGGDGRGRSYEYLDRFLGYVAEIIRLQGWKSRSAARFSDTPSTCAEALRHLYPNPMAPASSFLFSHPTQESIDEGKAAIAWCENLSDEVVEPSDYLHNIRVIARRGIIGPKQFGMAASIVAAYQREQARLKLQERRNTHPSEWVGEVGERRVFELMVEKVITIEGNYGVTKLHIMSDKDGNSFKWFCSGEPLNTGKEYLVRGTVKKHGEYKGWKETILSRCDVVTFYPFLCILQDGSTHMVEAEDEKDAKRRLVKLLGLERLPRGVKVEQAVPQGEEPVEQHPTSEG
jgi:hypothetical protein